MIVTAGVLVALPFGFLRTVFVRLPRGLWKEVSKDINAAGASIILQSVLLAGSIAFALHGACCRPLGLAMCTEILGEPDEEGIRRTLHADSLASSALGACAPGPAPPKRAPSRRTCASIISLPTSLAGRHAHRRARYVAGLKLSEVLTWSEDADNEERKRFVIWLLKDNFPRWLQARGHAACRGLLRGVWEGRERQGVLPGQPGHTDSS